MATKARQLRNAQRLSEDSPAWHLARAMGNPDYPGSTADRLASIAELRSGLELVENQIAFDLRAGGASWATIGAEFGFSKQAAQQRFGEVKP